MTLRCTAIMGTACCQEEATHRVTGTTGNIDRLACGVHLCECITLSLRQQPGGRRTVVVSELTSDSHLGPATMDEVECY